MSANAAAPADVDFVAACFPESTVHGTKSAACLRCRGLGWSRATSEQYMRDACLVDVENGLVGAGGVARVQLQVQHAEMQLQRRNTSRLAALKTTHNRKTGVLSRTCSSRSSMLKVQRQVRTNLSRCSCSCRCDTGCGTDLNRRSLKASSCCARSDELLIQLLWHFSQSTILAESWGKSSSALSPGPPSCCRRRMFAPRPISCIAPRACLGCGQNIVAAQL